LPPNRSQGSAREHPGPSEGAPKEPTRDPGGGKQAVTAEKPTKTELKMGQIRMGPKMAKPCFLSIVTHFSHIWRVTFAPQSLQNSDPSATILIWHWKLQAPSLDAASQDAQDPPGTPGYTYTWHDFPEGSGPRNIY